jgi:hypothetical protein
LSCFFIFVRKTISTLSKKYMKKSIYLFALAGLICLCQTACAQRGGDKSKRPSPPATATATLSSGAVITINYSQPALKGRTIGKDVEPMKGQVWRTGANEATVFETSKDITINGQKLAAGKYGFFAIMNDNDWTLIFNTNWNQWGAFSYKQAEDVLRVNVKASTTGTSLERLTYTADQSGKISLGWGSLILDFIAK